MANLKRSANRTSYVPLTKRKYFNPDTGNYVVYSWAIQKGLVSEDADSVPLGEGRKGQIIESKSHPRSRTRRNASLDGRSRKLRITRPNRSTMTDRRTNRRRVNSEY